MSRPFAYAVGLGFLAMPSAAEACWCSDNLSRADAIFVGRVISVADNSAKVRVLRVAKGRVSGTVSLGTSAGYCAAKLQPGEVRRLYVKRSEGSYYTDVCLVLKGH